jgi:hypothetical protein
MFDELGGVFVFVDTRQEVGKVEYEGGAQEFMKQVELRARW